MIDGNGGNDIANLGAGDDRFVWDPGDGSDTVEGRKGADTMTFNGSGANEHFGLSASGTRTRLVRDVGAITMNFDGIERVDVNSLGGNDVVTVDDLAATKVRTVNHDDRRSAARCPTRAPTRRSSTRRTPTTPSRPWARPAVLRSPAWRPTVNVTHAEAAQRRPDHQRLGRRRPAWTASTLGADTMKLTQDGGAGTTRCSAAAATTSLGGDGDDSLDGNQGNDTALDGAGDDSLHLGSGRRQRHHRGPGRPPTR